MRGEIQHAVAASLSLLFFGRQERGREAGVDSGIGWPLDIASLFSQVPCSRGWAGLYKLARHFVEWLDTRVLVRTHAGRRFAGDPHWHGGGVVGIV